MFDMKQWRDEHRVHLRQYNRDYYAKNKEKILAQQREHRRANGVMERKKGLSVQLFGRTKSNLTLEERRLLSCIYEHRYRKTEKGRDYHRAYEKEYRKQHHKETRVEYERNRLYAEFVKNIPETIKIGCDWYIPVSEWGKTINKVFGHKE